MKVTLKTLLVQAIDALGPEYSLSQAMKEAIQLEKTKNKEHGDYATNLALLFAKKFEATPRELASRLVRAMPHSDNVKKIEIAGPGFINFYLSDHAYHEIIPTILNSKSQYGLSTLGCQQKVIVEFVSANPTGPLHVGHGRGAAYGAAVADLLSAVGFDVHREYYVNDAGRQMDILAASVWLRYLSLLNGPITFPMNAYHGEYVVSIAEMIKKMHGDAFQVETQSVFSDLPEDEKPDGSGGNKEIYIDAVIQRAKNLLGHERYRIIFQLGLDVILDDIRDDLAQFGVTYDKWFLESQVKQNGSMTREIETLRKKGCLYEKEGAVWFRATDFGDEKDRVLIRENGEPTYFASDVAYHLNKYERGFEQIIDVLGADHHGYIARVKASMTALDQNAEKIHALFVQFAILYRGKERVQMSTRSGSFVTLRELREEVGNDAARFFYVSRKCEQHMDFDLDLAKSQSSENPVYYIQYAHARISSVFRQLKEKNIAFNIDNALNHLNRLETDYEKELLTEIAHYPEVIQTAALAYEPHQVAHYLRDLAHAFHTYYNACQFMADDDTLRDARLVLCLCVQYVLKNGLSLLGVSAPEKM